MGIEKIISKALIDSVTTHEEFMLVIDEKQNYLRLKESIRTKDIQLGDKGQINLTWQKD